MGRRGTTVKIRYLLGLYRISVILIKVDLKGLAGQSLEAGDSERTIICHVQTKLITSGNKLMCIFKDTNK